MLNLFEDVRTLIYTMIGLYTRKKMTYIKVRVVAGAKNDSLEKRKDIYYIKTKAPAERNLANKRVAELLHAELGKPVRLISGHKSPSKIFSVDDN